MCLFPFSVQAQLSKKSAWATTSEKQKKAAFEFADDYKEFMAVAKTELFTVKEVTRLAKKAGFHKLEAGSNWRPGAKFYDINRDRAMCVIVVGQNKLTDGARIIGSHIDSPRIEVKARPLYERWELALFQTVYHGGIKKYQWGNVPLALTGRLDKTDGSTQWINIGNQPGEPVFIIPDLAPHVDRQFRGRTSRDVLKGEELDPLVGSISDDSTSVKQEILNYLKQTYAMSEADFISAELALVPATHPADVGFDRGLVAAYGQDDRLCGYAATRASFSVEKPPYTTITYLVDNEETGSNNNTGARSDYLRALIHRILNLEMGGNATEFHVRAVLPKILVLSADVTTGIHPQFPSAQEASNSAKLGQGIAIKRYGRGNDPNSEFTARFRGILEKHHIPYQTHTYKVDVGGGGTIGGFM